MTDAGPGQQIHGNRAGSSSASPDDEARVRLDLLDSFGCTLWQDGLWRQKACVLSSCITNPRMIDWEFNQPLLTVDALDANCCRLCARANSSNILLWVKQHINLYPTQSLVLLRMAAM
ncbi:uncharacterized protein [Aegilops tauschii subsp. strangulata]|uniref:uncharacterized protein n=1 Tax=Aegilops tauschii subsp. strangulata TaxID=200361 RepID=UPI003CC86737